MTLLARFAALRDSHRTLIATGHDPFGIQFEQVLSATEAIVAGRKTILLGTNNYLGLTFDQSCIEQAVTVLRHEGTGTTGSRVANGTYSGHLDLERRLAAFYGRRAAMVFTTGYQANLGVLSTLCGPGDHLLIDADSHASIYDGCVLARAQVTRFHHNDPDDLHRRLERISAQPGAKLIVVEGIYSMLGDTAPLRDLVAVKRAHGAYLLVDEAHSLGVLGRRGRGLAELAGVEADVDFVVGTFSKSSRGGRRILRVRSPRFRSPAHRLPAIHVHGVAASIGDRLDGTGAAAHRTGAGAAPHPAGECALSVWKAV